MHDEPLRLIPREWREQTMARLRLGTDDFKVKVEGDVNPACRLIFKELMRHYEGHFEKVTTHVRVKRLVLSEQDRIGIGTFHPKDEKNQDSTELTGDGWPPRRPRGRRSTKRPKPSRSGPARTCPSARSKS
jgi:serine protein kinase